MIYISFFFFNDTATTEISTLSLHDALPIYDEVRAHADGKNGHLRIERREEAGEVVPVVRPNQPLGGAAGAEPDEVDRKSTRLNSSHANISYAVFCLKKKKFYRKSLYYIDTT